MTEYTVRECAAREQIDVGTVYLWLRKGALQFRRTPGGRIRILEPSSDDAAPHKATSNAIAGKRQ
jgi:excisionase family DNA binding protein